MIFDMASLVRACLTF